MNAALEELREENRQLRDLMRPALCWPQLGLTGVETALLAALVAGKGGVMSRDRLHHAVYWNADDAPEPKIVDVMICKIRPKLARIGMSIATHWGQGFSITRRRRRLKRRRWQCPRKRSSCGSPAI